MNRKVLAVTALFAVGILGLGLASAGGFGKGLWKGLNEEEREAHKERHQALREAIEANDYELWTQLMNEQIEEMKTLVNEETFNELKERHDQKTEFRSAMKEAKESGDWTRVMELKEEYGFDDTRGFGKYHGYKHRMHEQEMLGE